MYVLLYLAVSVLAEDAAYIAYVLSVTIGIWLQGDMVLIIGKSSAIWTVLVLSPYLSGHMMYVVSLYVPSLMYIALPVPNLSDSLVIEPSFLEPSV